MVRGYESLVTACDLKRLKMGDIQFVPNNGKILFCLDGVDS